MELKIGSKVFYPSHGAAKVIAEKEIEFNGDIKKYFEFEFMTNPLSISTPVENIDSLGIREVLPVTKIKDAMKELKKNSTKNPKVKDFNVMLNIFKDLEGSSDIKASVEIIQYCNYVKKTREKEGRLIPISIEKQLEEAVKNIVGELAIATDKPLEDASKTFSKATGITVEVVKD